jgi:hypothetical protein
VTMLYVEGPISRVDPLSREDLVLRFEPHSDDESALSRVVQLRETVNLSMTFIVEDDGTVIWSGPELLHECDARKERTRDRSTPAAVEQPPK